MISLTTITAMVAFVNQYFIDSLDFTNAIIINGDDVVVEVDYVVISLASYIVADVTIMTIIVNGAHLAYLNWIINGFEKGILMLNWYDVQIVITIIDWVARINQLD